MPKRSLRYNKDTDTYYGGTPFSITVTSRPKYRKQPYRWVSARTKQLSLEDATKGVDAAVGPLLHWFQPSQYVGAVRDTIDGKNPVTSMLRGNSGVVSKEYAAEHPVLSTVFNLGTDAYGYGVLKGARNLTSNLKFNASDEPYKIIESVRNATNSNARKFYRDNNMEYPEDILDIIQPAVEYDTNPIRYYKGIGLKGFKFNAYNSNKGRVIRMSPLSLFKHPNNYKGIVAHEAQHSFDYPMPSLSVEGNGYYIPNKQLPFSNIFSPLYKAASKGKWRGSPEEIRAEMANWKYRNNSLDTPYYKLGNKTDYINKTSKRFKISKTDASNILETLSSIGYF